jgi:hypothetical protein
VSKSKSRSTRKSSNIAHIVSSKAIADLVFAGKRVANPPDSENDDITLNRLCVAIDGVVNTPTDTSGPILKAIWESLYVKNGQIDPDKEWNSDTLDEIAETMDRYRPRPAVKEKYSG